jgi:hypothetical protein
MLHLVSLQASQVKNTVGQALTWQRMVQLVKQNYHAFRQISNISHGGELIYKESTNWKE